MLPVANHLPLTFEKGNARSRIARRAGHALRDIAHGFVIASAAIGLAWLIAYLVCTL
jgi:hypothetical protein